MQIQLSEEIEQALAAEAQALGVSVSEVSAQVLARHVTERRSLPSPQPRDHDRTLASYLERMRRQNPNFDTADPFAVDWQAVKAEGRRF